MSSGLPSISPTSSLKRAGADPSGPGRQFLDSREIVLSAEIRSKLRYVKTTGFEDMRLFPDFLIVGPQRTGTTWLHAHLRFHPQILLSEPKEIFFFNRLKDPSHPQFQSADLNWYLQHFREPLSRRLAKTAVAAWRCRGLYRPAVRGEATASYAAMDPDLIDEVVTLNPGIRVIMMIRDPVDRAWSHAKKDLVRKTGRRVDEVPADEFRAFFRDEYQVRCGRYVRNHDNWQARLRPGHMYVGAFEEIVNRPRELMLAVMSFLGVRSDQRYVGEDVHHEVNPTAKSAVPAEYRAYLEDLFDEDIAALEARFGHRG